MARNCRWNFNSALPCSCEQLACVLQFLACVYGRLALKLSVFALVYLLEIVGNSAAAAMLHSSVFSTMSPMCCCLWSY